MGVHERVTVEVSADMAEAMRRSVEDGAYRSESDIINEAMRDWARVRSTEVDVESLRAFIAEGDDSGPSIPAEQVYDELEAVIASSDRH